jgi:hypothetical protein
MTLCKGINESARQDNRMGSTDLLRCRKKTNHSSGYCSWHRLTQWVK